MTKKTPTSDLNIDQLRAAAQEKLTVMRNCLTTLPADGQPFDEKAAMRSATDIRDKAQQTLDALAELGAQKVSGADAPLDPDAPTGPANRAGIDTPAEHKRALHSDLRRDTLNPHDPPNPQHPKGFKK